MAEHELNWLQEERLDDIEDLSLYPFLRVMREIGMDIKTAAQQGATEQEWLDSQAMCVVEEAGEFIAEYRRCRGFARRPGNTEAMLSELADVIISAALMFQFLDDSSENPSGVDMHEEVQKKLRKIVTRGYVNKGE